MSSKTKSQLKLDPKNARKHSERNEQLVEQSLREVGAFRSVAADADGIIRAGNKTFEKAQQLGYKIKIVKGKPNELVVVQRDDLRGKKAARAALLDNLSSDMSEFDQAVIRQFAEQSPELLEGLLDYPELADLLTAAQAEAPEEFKEYDETLETQFKCPKCGYEWSGQPH